MTRNKIKNYIFNFHGIDLKIPEFELNSVQESLKNIEDLFESSYAISEESKKKIIDYYLKFYKYNIKKAMKYLDQDLEFKNIKFFVNNDEGKSIDKLGMYYIDKHNILSRAISTLEYIFEGYENDNLVSYGAIGECILKSNEDKYLYKSVMRIDDDVDTIILII